jgi:hypothetical protein
MFPEVSNLSWDKVIELRNHRFVESFRKKISDLIEHIESFFLSLIPVVDNEELGKVRTKSSTTKTRRDHVVVAYVIARAKG